MEHKTHNQKHTSPENQSLLRRRWLGSKFSVIKGFTLIETMVAITVFMVAIAGPITVAQKSLQASRDAEAQTTAHYLAQEGIEAVRHIRDSNWLAASEHDWLDGLDECTASSGCVIDILNDYRVDPYTSSRFLKRTSAGWYGYSAGEATPFRRQIKIVPTGSEAKVTATVTWDTGKVTLEDTIFDWKQVCAVDGAENEGSIGECSCPAGEVVLGSVCGVETAAIWADDTTLEDGGSTNIHWTSDTALGSCTNSWDSSTAANGTHGTGSLNGPRDYTYTIRCGALSPRSVVVHVAAPLPVVTSFKANNRTGSVAVASGSNVKLTWTSNNATSCKITSSPASGGSGSGLPANNTSTGKMTGALTGPRTYTYTITCSNGSRTSAPKTVQVSAGYPSVALSLTSNKAAYNPGEAINLTWNSSNATSCKATSSDWTASSISLDGTKSITGATTGNHTYTITCSNPDSTITRSVTVNVRNAAVTLSLTADKSSYDIGETIKLTWTPTNAVSCKVTSSMGDWNEAAIAATPVSHTKSLTAVTVGSHKYTVTCSNPDSTVTKSVTVPVNSAPLPPPPSEITTRARLSYTYASTYDPGSGSWLGDIGADHNRHGAGQWTIDASRSLGNVPIKKFWAEISIKWDGARPTTETVLSGNTNSINFWAYYDPAIVSDKQNKSVVAGQWDLGNGSGLITRSYLDRTWPSSAGDPAYLAAVATYEWDCSVFGGCDVKYHPKVITITLYVQDTYDNVTSDSNTYTEDDWNDDFTTSYPGSITADLDVDPLTGVENTWRAVGSASSDDGAIEDENISWTVYTNSCGTGGFGDLIGPGGTGGTPEHYSVSSNSTNISLSPGQYASVRYYAKDEMGYSDYSLTKTISAPCSGGTGGGSGGGGFHPPIVF